MRCQGPYRQPGRDGAGEALDPKEDKEDTVHPYVVQALAAQRVKDWQREAALARLAKQARRAGRGVAEISAERRAGREKAPEMGQVQQAQIPELESAAGDHRHPVGAGRACGEDAAVKTLR
jgi:hypothetical protein